MLKHYFNIFTERSPRVRGMACPTHGMRQGPDDQPEQPQQQRVQPERPRSARGPDTSPRSCKIWKGQLHSSTCFLWANPGLFFRLFSVFPIKHFHDKSM